MTRGYIEVEEIPKDCIKCQFGISGICLVTGTTTVVIRDYKPDWCPIKEHELWKCAKKAKEEMLEFYGRQRGKDEP